MVLVSGAGDWRSPPLRVAAGFRGRMGGLRPAPDGEGLLVWARSVHSFGVGQALWIVDLAEDGRPVRTAMLLPRRLHFRRRQGWILELPGAWPPPPLGVPLRPVTGDGRVPPVTG